MNSNFAVIGVTRVECAAPAADAPTTLPFELLK